MTDSCKSLRLCFRYISRDLELSKEVDGHSLESRIDALFEDMGCHSVALWLSLRNEMIPLTIIGENPDLVENLFQGPDSHVVVVNECILWGWLTE